MAVEVLPDRIEESIVEQTTDKLTIDRTFFVCGVEGDANAIATNAFTAAGLPVVNSSTHPVFTNAICRSKRFVPKSANSGLVVCRYELVANELGGGTLFTLRVGSRLIQETTSFDKTGKKLEVSYTYTAGGANKVVKKVGVVTKMMPVSYIESEVLSVGSPGTLSQTYTGKVNSDTWQGGAAGTWLCEEISGQLFAYNGSLSTSYFRVTRRFLYNPRGWLKPVVFFGFDGKVPADVPDLTYPLAALPDAGTGVAVYKVYGEATFTGAFTGL